MSRLRDQRGFTLVEVLLVCVISTVVLGATVAAFASFYRADRAGELQRDNVEDARVALGVVARQLRNLANPVVQPGSTTPQTIYRATANDFIFQTSDPAKTWVRYCLDTTTSGASAAHAKLWTAEAPSNSSDATVPAGMTGACPGSGTGIQTRIVSQNVSNVTGGVSRPVFTYACMSGQPVTCPASSSEYPKITMVGAQLFIDASPTDHIREMQVTTAVFLRNQNQAPVALVSGPPYSQRVAPYKFMLNGSGSTDPEGRSLDFHWYLDTATPTLSTALPATFSCSAPGNDVWTGPTYTNDFGAANVGRTFKVWLAVCDPGGLYDIKGPYSVTVTG
jgi:prepilin-type N-terminal cleavage/methylation domain-containing protein